MPTLDFISSFMYANLQGTTQKKYEFVARCPYCGDSAKDPRKKRFHLKYIDDDSSMFNCFNCNQTGTFYDLYAFINGISTREAYKQLKGNGLELLRNGKKKVEKKSEKIEQEEHDFSYILKDCISLDDDIDGMIKKNYYDILTSFYEKRSIDRSTKLFIAYRGPFKNRVIIPIYDKEKMIYFQGRAINNDMIPKYKNPVSEKKHIILNKNNFEKDKHIIITEGILDALSIGNQGTVCMGASISDEFISTLQKFTDKEIIISLDNDETGKKNMLKLMKESKFKNCVKYFVFPYKYSKKVKDLNELKVKNFEKDIYAFVVENSYSLLKANVLLKS